MKRIISLSIAIIVLISSLTACSMNNSFKGLVKKIEKTQNYKMKISYTLEGFGKVTQTMYVDENKKYYPENDTLGYDEYYTEEIDDYIIEYHKDYDDKWKKNIEENDGDDDLSLEENDIWNLDNYDKDGKNVYVQKKNVIFDNFDNVVITVLEDSLVIECTMILDLSEIEVKIIISEIGEHTIELPTVK